MARRQNPGTILKIGLGDGTHTYGRELRDPHVAVYDTHTSDAMAAEEIVSRPALFFVSVVEAAFEKWKKVGHVPLRSDELPIPEQFVQSRIDPKDCKIMDAEGNMRKVTVDECEGLDAMTIWDLDDVEERVRDHYAGTPNKKMQRLRLKRL